MADKIVWKIILDVLVLACVGLPLLFMSFWAKPYERGYFENDMSIRLPFYQESVTVVALGCGGIVFVVATIILTEIVRHLKGKNTGEKFLGGTLVPGWIWESYTCVGIFGFGALCQQLTSTITKYVVGRLRPHFYAVCQPTPDATSPLNRFDYIQDFMCAQTDEALLKDMRLSFPSAHSCFAMYCAVFFICYVQVKGKWDGSKLLRHGIQFAALLAAWYVGLTRVQENYHHWSDVGAGFAIGAAYGILVFKFILKPKKYSTLPWDEPVPQSVLPRPVLAR